MLRTVEAVIDAHGNVRLLEEVQLPGPRRAFGTILEDARTAMPGQSRSFRAASPVARFARTATQAPGNGSPPAVSSSSGKSPACAPSRWPASSSP